MVPSNPIQGPVAFAIDHNQLVVPGGFADRFVRQFYFSPYDPAQAGDPFLTLHQKYLLGAVAGRMSPRAYEDFVEEHPDFAELIGELVRGSRDPRDPEDSSDPQEPRDPQEGWTDPPRDPYQPGETYTTFAERRGNNHDDAVMAARVHGSIETLARMVRTARTGEEASSDFMTALEEGLGVAEEATSSLVTVTAAPTKTVSSTSSRLLVATDRTSGTASTTAQDATQAELNQMTGLLKSEIGFLFLDRTRIRPAGFAIGEHVFSMSLAPGEEVIVEQKTFTKRESSFEEVSEQESQLDLEMASTLSTELQEGMTHETGRTQKSGFSVGGEAGVDIDGIVVKVTPNYSEDIEDASKDSSTSSVKDSSTSSSKVASKYRSQHKISFKVSTEDRFESTSKRTIKNPNPYTPIDLLYFKILQRLELHQERAGVRLCWSPAVKDPGFGSGERVREAREQFFKQVTDIPLPPKPLPPVRGSGSTRALDSGEFECTAWGIWNDMRKTYTVPAAIPSGFVWDGDAAAVKASLQKRTVNISRSNHAHVVGEPWTDGNNLYMNVHVGCDWNVGTRGSIFVRFSGTAVTDPALADQAYQQAYQQWQTQVADWQKTVDGLTAAATAKAEKEFEAWLQEWRTSMNPRAELMNRLMDQAFPSKSRDEVWEIDLWNKIFDWDNVGFHLYPAWWSDQDMRDPLKDPNDFTNASWAKLFLPVKPGYEALALRWIFGRALEGTLDAKHEKMIKETIADLEGYRKKHFGSMHEIAISSANGGCPSSDQKYICLAKWEELLPTDGTHVEVLQASTSAIDDATRVMQEDAASLRAARLTAEEKDLELKEAALKQIKGPTDVAINIAVDTDGS